MNSNHVGSNWPDHFGRFRLAVVRGVSLANTGNTVANLTISQGTEYIVRQITVMNPSGSVASANVAVLSSSDGNTSNAISNNVVISSVSAAHTWQDLGLATAAATTSYTAGQLYLLVNTASGNSNTVDIAVYGDVVLR